MKKTLCTALCVIFCFLLCSCSTGEKESYRDTCTLLIECEEVLKHYDDLNKEKTGVVPEDGIIFAETECGFNEGESVYDVLRRVCNENKIHLDASITPAYNTAYVKGINNLYEFDCGEFSGWTYMVNGELPQFGCSDYTLTQGDRVVFHYICEFSAEF